MSDPDTEPAYVFEDRQTPDDWHVQWNGDSDAFEMVIFSGPRTRGRTGDSERKCEGATGSLAIVASDRGPSHPCGITPTDRDCQQCLETRGQWRNFNFCNWKYNLPHPFRPSVEESSLGTWHRAGYTRQRTAHGSKRTPG